VGQYYQNFNQVTDEEVIAISGLTNSVQAALATN
jgi:predicted phosphoribosyltransferase